MRIMIITTPEELGGGETYVINLILGLPHHQFLVLTSLGEFHKQLISEGIKSDILLLSIKFLSRLHIIIFLLLVPFSTIQYLFYLLLFNPDVVHIQSKEEQILVSPIAKFLGKKVIWTLHGPVEKGNKVVDFMFLKTSLTVNKIIAVSNFVERSVQSFGIVKPIAVIYHGVDLSRFRPAKLKSDQRVIGFVGRLVKVKRPELFLESSMRTLEKMDKIQAWIIGEGYLKKKLEERVSVSPVKDRINFLGFRKDIESVIRQLSILLVTSRTEGLDISALEAISSGVPVVSVNVGALSEIINKETGLLVNSDNPEIISNSLLSLIQNDKLFAKMKKTCRRMAEEKFSLDRMLRETDLIYKE